MFNKFSNWMQEEEFGATGLGSRFDACRIGTGLLERYDIELCKKWIYKGIYRFLR